MSNIDMLVCWVCEEEVESARAKVPEIDFMKDMKEQRLLSVEDVPDFATCPRCTYDLKESGMVMFPFVGCVEFISAAQAKFVREKMRKERIAAIAARNALRGGPKPYVQPAPFRGTALRDGLQAIAQVPTPPAPKPTPPAPEPVPPTVIEEPVAVAPAPKLSKAERKAAARKAMASLDSGVNGTSIN